MEMDYVETEQDIAKQKLIQERDAVANQLAYCTERFQTCQRKYQEIGIVLECLTAQAENIQAGQKLLTTITDKLDSFKVEILISAQKETNEYLDELIANLKHIDTIKELLINVQNKLNVEAKEYVSQAAAIENKLDTLNGQLQYGAYGPNY